MESDYPNGDGTKWTDEERLTYTKARRKRALRQYWKGQKLSVLRAGIRKLKRRVKALEDRIRDMQPINVPEFRATVPIRSHIRSAFHELFPSVPTFLPDQPKPEPQTSGEAKPMYLVDPYTLVSSRDGVYLLRPGEEIRIPFTGRMRLLWERQYLEQEKHREHVARNRARAPRRPRVRLA